MRSLGKVNKCTKNLSLFSAFLLVLFGGIYGSVTHGIVNGASDAMDTAMLSFYAGSLVLITVTLKMLLMISHWTMPIYVAFGVSMVGYLLVFIGLEVVGFLEPGVFTVLHSMPLYYLGLIVIPVFCLLPDYTLAFYRRQFKPSDAEIIQEDQRLAKMKQQQQLLGKGKNGKGVQDDLEDQEAMMEMDVRRKQHDIHEDVKGGAKHDSEEDEDEEEDDEDEEVMEGYRGVGVAEKAPEKNLKA